MKSKHRIMAGLLVLAAIGARAELSTIVVPGYTFSVGERLTLEKLNLAARPSVFVTGTVDGSNSLSAGSVFPVHLNATTAGSNLLWTINGTVVANQGVNVAQVHTNVAGLGLSGGNGTALRVNVDTNTIRIVSDTVSLQQTGITNLSPAQIAWVTNTVLGASANGTNTALAVTNGLTVVAGQLGLKHYVSAVLTLTNDATGQIFNYEHNWGRVPVLVQARLVALQEVNGYAVGDEVDTLNALDIQDRDQMAVIWGANATNIWVTRSTGPITAWRIKHKTTGVLASTTSVGAWGVKVYAIGF